MSEKHEHALKMDYNGYNSHDSESHHVCPVCCRDYGSWDFFRKGIKNGECFACEKCGTLLKAPD